MPKEEFPKWAAFHWPTLQAVRAAGGSATNDEINAAVIDTMGFDEEQQSILHRDGPQTALQIRCAFARTWLKGMGLLENTDPSVWSTTPHGRVATENELPGLRTEYSRRQREARKERQRREAEAETEEGSPDSDELGEDWKAQLLAQLMTLDPDAFERLSQRLLRAAGFVNTEVTGRSGDGGIDGTGDYRISLLTFPVYFQCKRYQAAVGAGAVRDFRGAMAGRGDKGMIITTSSFTSSAKEEATRDGAPPIDLIDGDQLCELLRDHRLGVEVQERTVYDIEIIPGFFSDLN